MGITGLFLPEKRHHEEKKMENSLEKRKDEKNEDEIIEDINTSSIDWKITKFIHFLKIIFSSIFNAS